MVQAVLTKLVLSRVVSFEYPGQHGKEYSPSRPAQT